MQQTGCLHSYSIMLHGKQDCKRKYIDTDVYYLHFDVLALGQKFGKLQLVGYIESNFLDLQLELNHQIIIDPIKIKSYR